MFPPGYPDSLLTYQVAIYDPEYILTPTGDAEILFSYSTVKNHPVISQASIGISSPDGNTGIFYQWRGMLHPTSQPIANRRSILLTTRATGRPSLMVHSDDLDPIEGLNPDSVAVRTITVANVGTGAAVVNAAIDKNASFLKLDNTALRVTEENAAEFTLTIDGHLLADKTPIDTIVNVFFTEPWSGWTQFIPVHILFDHRYGVSEQETAVNRFELSPAYPNPFNAVTTVRYTIAEAGAVRLAIFDLNGRMVRELVNERQSAGNHEAVFDARALPSGVYTARLTAGDHTAIRKMALIK